MASDRRSAKKLAIPVIAALIFVIILLVYFGPFPPHYAFVSEKSATDITNHNFTSSMNSSTTAVTPTTNGRTSFRSVQFSGHASKLSITDAEYNTSGMAVNAYNRAKSGLLVGGGDTAVSDSGSYRGFTYFYTQTTLLAYSVFLAVGQYGKYIFIIVGAMNNISPGQIVSLVKAQVNAMEAVSV